jgi:imidazolonepropionase-like amidohydrolase
VTAKLFTGARLIAGDGSDPIDGAALLVVDGVIRQAGPAETIAVPANAERIDLTGKTIMPTIVNPHVHLGYLKDASTDAGNFSRENVLDHLRRFVYYGVSVVQSLGTDRDDVEITIRDEQRAGVLTDPALAFVLSASNGIAAPTPGEGNGGAFFAPEAILEASTPEQARQQVRRIAAKKPDVIKFWVDDRGGTKVKFGPDVSAALIDEAHRHGIKAIAHIYDLEDAKGVVRAGVDGTAHLVREPGPDDELLGLMKERNVFVFTSLGIQRALVDDLGWLDDPALAETVGRTARDTVRAMFRQAPESVVATMKDGYDVLQNSLTRYLDAGVRVLLSGDTGVLAQFPGFSEHRELEAMVVAGMRPLDAITAGTSRPAETLGLDDRGSLVPGKRADFIVLDADPLADIRNTRRIAGVVIAGDPIDRTELRNSIVNPSPAGPPYSG